MTDVPLPTPAQRQLTRPLAMTLMIVALYMAGRFVFLPGINPDAVARLVSTSRLTIETFSIFALGVTPIYSTLIVIEVLKLGMSSLTRWEQASRQRVPYLLLVLALLIAAFQSVGVSRGLAGLSGMVTIDPTTFQVTSIATMIAATALLGWCINMISSRGIGDGFLLSLSIPTIMHTATNTPLFFTAWQAGALQDEALPTVAYLVLSGIVLVLAQVRQEAAAATRSGLSRHAARDVWTPLLATFAAGFVVAPVVLLQPSLTTAQFATYARGGFVHMGVVTCLIALFTSLRTDDRGAPWMMAGAQIAVCLAGELLLHFDKLAFAMDPSQLILIVGTAVQFVAAIREKPFAESSPSGSAT